MTLRILDACCGVGGATRGYKLALPDCHVTGVDIDPQPDYVGDAFVQGDAVAYVREHGSEYDFIHASWPCQYSCALTKGTNKGRVYPNLIPAGRRAQQSTGRPWVIENVAGAEIRKDLRLCGDMFRRPDGSYELAVMRHRYFEFSPDLSVPQPRHPAPVRRVAGRGPTASGSPAPISRCTAGAAARAVSRSGVRRWGSTGRGSAGRSRRRSRRRTRGTSRSACSGSGGRRFRGRCSRRVRPRDRPPGRRDPACDPRPGRAAPPACGSARHPR